MEQKAFTIQIRNKTFWKLELIGSDQRIIINKHESVEALRVPGKVSIKVLSPLMGLNIKDTLTVASNNMDKNLIYEAQLSYKKPGLIAKTIFLFLFIAAYVIYDENPLYIKATIISMSLIACALILLTPRYELKEPQTNG